MTGLPDPSRDWDDAYANSAHIPSSADLPARWSAGAAAYRASGVRIETDISYGKSSRERFDLIWPEGAPQGLAVFIHGGYWMATDKDMWTDRAEGARANGWAVAVPQYALAPEARISAMTQQIAAAIEAAAMRVDGPIRLAGHSAGGHLATRMACDGGPLHPKVWDRVEQVLSISGLHDLRPLMWTKMNKTLGLSEAEAIAESPVLCRPIAGAQVTAWVGSAERPEFLRQAQLLAMMWDGLQADINCEIDGDHDHFSVIEALKDPDSKLVSWFLGT